jgi:hypothetical protein
VLYRFLFKTSTNSPCFAEQYISLHYSQKPLIRLLLTPWSAVLLEKLTGFKLVKKFPAFYGTRKFITAFTSSHHLSLCNPVPRQVFMIHTKLVVSTSPKPKLEDNTLSAIRNCVFHIFAATLHTGGPSSIRNLRTRHAVVITIQGIKASDTTSAAKHCTILSPTLVMYTPPHTLFFPSTPFNRVRGGAVGS